MQVPPELQRELWNNIQELERNITMPYITSIERMGIEKGLQQEAITILQRILAYRFGPINQATLAHLNIATKEQIEYWIERTLDAKSLDDVFAQH
jgi:hypothetical protein